MFRRKPAPAFPSPLPRAAAPSAISTMMGTDFVINCVNDVPRLVRCDSTLKHNWIKVRTIGTNRSGIGARLRCVAQIPGETKPHSQIDEVRSGGGYFSQSDLRVHFGIGKAEKVDLLEIKWPSGAVDTLKDIKPNQVIYVKEGQGIIRNVTYDADKKAPSKK
jgi:enediyne biosynthesis protein E4